MGNTRVAIHNSQENEMGQRIDQLCEDLRIKLWDIEIAFNDLKTKMEEGPGNAEEAVRDQLAQVRERIESERAKIAAAQVQVKDWESRETATHDKIAKRYANGEVHRLQKRAEHAEAFAAASIDVALAAVDEAERASLEAWLARKALDSARDYKTAVLLP
jgi:chromosome segregation ATPase